MKKEEYSEEIKNNVDFLNHCIDHLKKGMDFLEEKGIQTEFKFEKRNQFVTQFNESFYFKAIDNGNELSYNSVEFESGDVNTILDKAFNYMCLNEYSGFDNDNMLYDFGSSYYNDINEVEKKKLIGVTEHSKYEDIFNHNLRTMETNLNYDESVRTVKFTLSNINPNETRLEMRLSDNTVIEKGAKELEKFDIGAFFYNEEYIKDFIEEELEIDTPIKNFKGLTRENLVEENENPAYIRYKFDNDYGLLVTNKFIEKNGTDKFVETKENPYRVHILKYDDKDNYFVDRYTKATQVKVNGNVDDVFYDYQISCKSSDDVKELIEQVKEYEKTKTLDKQELKEIVKDIVDKSLDKDTKEHKILSEKLDIFGDNQTVKSTIKDIIKEKYKEQAVCIKESDIFKNVDKVFEDKGINRYKENIKFVENFSKEQINEFLKIESKFEKEVFEKVGSFLIEDDDKLLIGDERRYRNKLNKEISKLAKDVGKEMNLSNEELIKYFDEEDNLPDFFVYTESGLAFASNFNEEINEQANKEFLEILSEYGKDEWSFDIKELGEIDKIEVCHKDKNGELIAYNGYDRYIKDVADKLSDKGFKDKFTSIGETVKEKVYDLIQEDEKEPFITKKDYEKLSKKLDDRIKLFDKKNTTKENKEKDEKNSEKEIEL
jgi:hypothetical protein